MIEDREASVSAAFVSIANSLVDGFDMVELLTQLTADCALLLDIDAAGMLLADERGILHVAGASSDDTRDLELFQLQRDEGPCLDCYHAGVAVLVDDLAASADRWPQFVPAARAVGFVAVHALPMRLRQSVLGTLGLFSSRPGALSESDLTLAQALAHVASIALVTEKAASDQTMINTQLKTALTSRIVLEQAKGLLAQTGGLDMDRAFSVLRRYSRDHGLRLSEVAESLVTRTLSTELVLASAPTADQ
jgi:GAF domain-containing protein